MIRAAQTRANVVRLKRQNHAGAILLVEGRDDRVFCEQFLDSQLCKVEVMEGKENVIEVKQILVELGLQGVLAMVDRDHDELTGIKLGPDFVMPDHADLECMLLHSQALERVLVEHGSREKIERLRAPARTMIMEAAVPFGRLRLLSLRNRLALKFDGLDYSKCVDIESLDVDESKLIQCVLHRSMRPDLGISVIAGQLESIKHEGHAASAIVSGEDATGILSVGLRKVFGSNSSTVVNAEQLKSDLRFAYSRESMLASGLWAGMVDWQRRNPAFQIVGKERA